MSQEECLKDWEQFGEKEGKDDQMEGGQCLFCSHCNCLQLLEVQLAQLAFHKGQVCTCEQVEV